MGRTPFHPDRARRRGGRGREELPQHRAGRGRRGEHRWRRRRNWRRLAGRLPESPREAAGEVGLMDARATIIRPVVSEKSYALIGEGKYTFRVDDRAHKTQIASAIEEIFDVKVAAVRTSKVRAKPKRRGLHQGKTRAWKKAVVQLAPGERIELFEGAETA